MAQPMIGQNRARLSDTPLPLLGGEVLPRARLYEREMGGMWLQLSLSGRAFRAKNKLDASHLVCLKKNHLQNEHANAESIMHGFVDQ